MCGAEKGTGTQSGIRFTSFQKITAWTLEIFFAVGSKKKAAEIALLKHLS